MLAYSLEQCERLCETSGFIWRTLFVLVMPLGAVRVRRLAD